MKKLVVLCTTAIIVAAGTMSVSAQEYEVEKGDSLWKIAQENNVTTDRLIDINDLKTTVIHPKQTLTLTDQYTYTVKKGDTLSEIGNSEGVSVNDLKEWNDLSSDLIVIGQELEITGSKAEGSQDEQQAQPEQKKAAANQNEKQVDVSDQKQTDTQSDELETKAASKSNNDSSKSSNDQPDGKTISVKATAYTAECDGCSGVTYTGVDLNNNRDAKVIAVDPSVIPLGSTVYVEGYGYAEAEDIGGAIKGNRVDLHVATQAEAKRYGVQNIDVTIVD